MGDPTDSGMAPQSFEIAQNGLGKGGLVRRDRLGKPALRPSSETVITPPNYPGNKKSEITTSLLK